MGIPISKYIDISSAVVATNDGQRSWACLALTPDAFITSEDSSPTQTAIKTSYDAGDVLKGLSLADVLAYFGETSNAYKFAVQYFGLKDRAGRTPYEINIAKCSSYDAVKSRITSIVDNFSDFGSFAYVGSMTSVTAGSIKEVAQLNESLHGGYTYCVAVDASAYGNVKDALWDIEGTHVVFYKSAEASSFYEALSIPSGWIACHDYTRPNASNTIDYEPFNKTATVTDGTLAGNLDKARVNYMGLVQSRGINRKFYQTGVNMDGVQLGVYVDEAWIRSEIEAGWFRIATGSTRIPANLSGVTRVNAMITDVAEMAIENGCILVDKPLTREQIETINEIANTDGAAVSVQSMGYYINVDLREVEGGRYEVQYTLIYSKGDHIGKVVGQHYLV